MPDNDIICLVCDRRLVDGDGFYQDRDGPVVCSTCKHTPTDPINPDHYKVTLPSGEKMECIDVIHALGLGYNLGNALKYQWRAGKKPGQKKAQDLKKAIWYLNNEVEREENG